MKENPEVYQLDKPKARKPHQCYECVGTIEPGEVYHRHHGIWDEPRTFKVCLDCDKLRADIDAGLRYDERTGFGELPEAVIEGRFPRYIERFIAIKQKRGAKVHESWINRLEDLRAKGK